jgi:hypothetical protein
MEPVRRSAREEQKKARWGGTIGACTKLDRALMPMGPHVIVRFVDAGDADDPAGPKRFDVADVKALAEVEVAPMAEGAREAAFRELERGFFCNGALSAFDLTGRTSDRVMEMFEIKPYKGSLGSASKAFGASAAHLRKAMGTEALRSSGDEPTTTKFYSKLRGRMATSRDK